MAQDNAIPTTRLRFIERESIIKDRPHRVLQQWWERHKHGYGHDEIVGEWRDVPLDIYMQIKVK